MISKRDLLPAIPASLAALGEAGVVYLLVHDVAAHEGRLAGGPLFSYPEFALMYVAAVALATAFRRSSLSKVAIPVVAVGLSVIVGTAWGAGASGTATVVILMLAVGLRVATLAVREWREPIATSFGVWGAILLAEAMFLGKDDPEWSLMAPITVVFFAASLTSRAASVWLVSRLERGESGEAVARPHRSAVPLLAGLGTALGLSLLLGAPRGPVQVSGGIVYRAAAETMAFLGGLVALVVFPVLSWFLGLIDLSFDSRRVGDAIQQIGNVPNHGSSSNGIERVIGSMLFVGVFILLVLMIWRRWKLLLPREEETPQVEPEPEVDYVPKLRRRRRTRRPRRELPADTVRRWYAEMLLALERLGLPKAPSRTPGEYLPEVTEAFPESARGAAALTRAYEQVRYGSVTLDQEAVWRLEVERDGAMAALQRARRLDAPDPA